MPAFKRLEPKGFQLAVIIFILAMANFLAILDTTVANVLVNHIAGSMAVSTSSGTWVITGYSVAEAIMVPLTGWLAERFGPVKVFSVGILGFGLFSLLCGMATSLNMLIAFRILLGMSGGPLMPLSQTLLLKIVPKRFATPAMAVWSMTTVLAPIAGPVLGGWLGDNWGWQWAFYVKVPFALALGLLAWKMLRPYETPIKKEQMDFSGLALLILWVGALQILLGTGQDADWFNSDMIVSLAIISAVGFATFLIWEGNEKSPVVNLSIFANRAFSVSLVVIFLAFGAVFAAMVLTPMWLQGAMGYTATWAGYNSAFSGVLAVAAAPAAAILMTKIDHRLIIMVGLLVGAVSVLMRVGFTDQMSFWQLAVPQLLQGLCLPLVMIPLMDMSVSSLPAKDLAAGAGQFNFVRTLATAFSTAIVSAIWQDAMKFKRDSLVGSMDTRGALNHFTAQGAPIEQVRSTLDGLVQGQAVQLATNYTYLLIGITLLIAAGAVWLAPRPRPAGGGGPAPH
ncbi:MAG: DHA2 family efflux MFS transporter permease subunit [Rhizomicrobium sp.]